MGKTFETKSKILVLLRSGKMTPTEICKALGLAPSTVSQHLKELRAMGRIEETYDEHFHNIKYYSIASAQPMEMHRLRNPALAKYAIGAILFIAVIGMLSVLLQNISANTVQSLNGNATRYVQITLTDPPHVPNGTTALIATYSGLEVQYRNGLSTNVVNVNSSGSVNLMQLINASTVLGSAKIPANSQIARVWFDITSATITISGTTYNVIVPNQHIVANVIAGNTNSNSTILLDLSPTVAVIYTNNSTLFVMAPSIKAVEIAGVKFKSGLFGHERHPSNTVGLNETEREELGGRGPNITITHVSLSRSGNTTSLSVTVKDNSNQSVVLRHVMVSGDEDIKANLSIFAREISIKENQIAMPFAAEENSSAASSSQAELNRHVTLNNDARLELGSNAENIKLNGSELSQVVAGTHAEGNGGIHINASAFDRRFINASGNLSIVARLKLNDSEISKFVTHASNANKIETEQKHFRSLNFLVGRNGTLALPFSEHDFSDNATGYNLSAGQSVTLRFTGQITLGHGRIIISLPSGTHYEVEVRGEEGAHASANVTAG